MDSLRMNVCVAVRYGARAAGHKAATVLIALGLAGAAAADPVRIVALGDSLVHGYGLLPEDGFVPQLERWLAAEGVEATVANAGVSGDTTAGGRARLAWSVGEGADALVVVLGGNDLLRGIDPAVSRENLSALVAEARAMGMPVLLGGMRAPGNYGADYKTAFDAIYPEIAEAQGALLYPEFLAGVTDDPRLWQADGLHPNADGVGVIVEGMGPLVLELIASE
ncbi:MAG: arylesterase [Pseudomonadota bacterium]